MNSSEPTADRSESSDERGSSEAFVRATYAELFQWFWRLSGCRDRAADLTQESFTAFWESQARIPANVSSRTWLYAIGRNLWHKQLRQQRSCEPADPELAEAGDRTPEQSALDREFREAAERAVRELPDDLREAFILRFWQNFDYEEIGAIQEVTAGLARWRYFAARRRLHVKLAAWAPEPKRAGEDRHAR
jgi:RNA polymerase sigma-70 factor (ECF subfamily)